MSDFYGDKAGPPIILRNVSAYGITDAKAALIGGKDSAKGSSTAFCQFG